MRFSIALLLASPCGAIGLVRGFHEADQWGSMQECVNFFTTCGSDVVPTTISGVGDLFKTCCVDGGHDEATCQNIKDEMLQKHTGDLGSGVCDELQELKKEHELSTVQSLHNRRKSRESQNTLESHDHSAENLDASLERKGETPSPTPSPTLPEEYVTECSNRCNYCQHVYSLSDCGSSLLETSAVQSLHKRRQLREAQNEFESSEEFVENLDASFQKKSGATPAPPAPNVPSNYAKAVGMCNTDCTICTEVLEYVAPGGTCPS